MHQDERKFLIRPYQPQDRLSVLGLASRLTIGIAPWLDREAVLAAAQNWLAGSIDRIGPEQAVFVAESFEGLCVGCVSVQHNTHFSGDTQAYIGELIVGEAAEGQGIGQALMANAEAWANSHGYKRIALDTGALNVHARGFYEHLGYAEESVKLVKVLRHDEAT